MNTNEKAKKLPLGVSDFKKIIDGNYYYIDKTLFIKDVLAKGDTIILLPRPRRFGKTLNLSMLKYFFDCCPNPNRETKAISDNKKLFDSLAIARTGEEYLDKMGKHPVIFLTFKDVKELDWESCLEKTMQLLQAEYSRHHYLLKWKGLMDHEKDYFKRILNLTGSKVDYENSLGNLLIFLNRYYDERAVILIDEYDAPIHMGFNRGYYDEIINFMRNFLSSALKDTDTYLEKAVITGIMRIAKESIFSGLNNPGVYTLLSEQFSEYFGFTEEEVEGLLKEFDLLDYYNEVKKWYNGYRFGSRVIYNPWSIINFLGSSSKRCQPYWLHTSDNAIVELLLSGGGKELKEELELLICGETVEKEIKDNIVLKNLAKRENLVWSFLLMAGYLKQSERRFDESNVKSYYRLAIPNLEVKTIYIDIIENFFADKTGDKIPRIMLKALIDGDIKLFEKMLRKIVLAVFSYHDFGGEPELVYHALVTGMLVWLTPTHEIKSNRESGYGRYDIMIIPRDPNGIGYVIEFKSVDTDDNETPETALEAALKQIEEKKYETELMERKIKHIKKLAIAFSGKDVHLKESGK